MNDGQRGGNVQTDMARRTAPAGPRAPVAEEWGAVPQASCRRTSQPAAVQVLKSIQTTYLVYSFVELESAEDEP